MSKVVELDGVSYPSLAAAARALGVTKQAIWSRLNPGRERWRESSEGHAAYNKRWYREKHGLPPDAPGDLRRREEEDDA